MDMKAPGPPDFRAELARLGLPHYVAAARVGVHPTRFSRFLWGRERMPSGFVQRLREIIEEERRRLDQEGV